ncbi:UNVERIFIED_CONTAM: hypothetical protein Slati_2683800 [Sesamum latifolium]|uniref:Integrase catalytic domain-containing protein n=1 Tax=Sesamum latifolium TaxID=2727402 RepID=A0AAW2VVJ7_9LAMI
MLQDTHELVRRFRACQEHANVNHQPTVLMQPLESPCPFDQWGLDLVGPFPQATGQRKFFIVAVDYFMKWVEAEALAKTSEKEVIKFLWKNIICRFGILRPSIRQWDSVLGQQTEVTNRTILQYLKTGWERRREHG